MRLDAVVSCIVAPLMPQIDAGDIACEASPNDLGVSQIISPPVEDTSNNNLRRVGAAFRD